MEPLFDLIKQHSNISTGAAVVLILITGFILKKLKTLAIILIIVASLIIYGLLQTGRISKSDVNDLREKAKGQVIEKINEQVKKKTNEAVPGKQE